MLAISLVVILAACSCLTYGAPLAEDNIQNAAAPRADVNYRLPLTIKPISYTISLRPNLNESDPEKFTFKGECYIEIQAVQITKEIQLHIKNLNISVSEYYRKNATTEPTKLPNATPNSLTSIVVYNLNENLQPNVSYILHYIYTGSMDEDMHGFYRSNYTTSENVTKWLGSTQFQRNHARRVFPSFDEPKFKATFDLSLTRHRSLKTAGPTRIKEIKPNGQYVTDVYETTPKMSTYLLAFIVSEFYDRFDGDFGVLARPEYYKQTEYSSDVGKKTLAALDDYFSIPYYSMGNDKMQMAAIPDFSAGAMENWGLLTYRERGLLYDPEDSNLNSKQYIASIVAHEQAHMWFGDLVTCDWWSYTWLNEGFASYFQYFATHLVEPNMRMDQQFVVNLLQSVMGMDATNATNPMSDENTNTEEDLARMFNSISYNKGGSFIRMTKHILGEDAFKESLNKYLKAYAYTNTIPENLFAVWREYFPSKFAQYAEKYLNSFTLQVGYPFVTVNRTSETIVEFSQKRFMLKDADKADTNLLYTVPITYTTNTERDYENLSPKFFLEEKPYVVPVHKDVKWIMANIQETGYYRVNYDNETWNEIKKSLNGDNWSGIHELNRAQIVDDLFNFARAGVVDYSLAFDVTEYLSNEYHYIPWTSAFNALSYLHIRLGDDTAHFSRYIRYISNKVYNALGFEERANDTILEIYTRAKILAWACQFGRADCIAKAKTHFSENLKANPVPVNVRPVVYCTAMREGNDADFEKLYQKYKTERVATEETLILTSFGCVKDPKLVSRVFNMILSTEIRRQDKSSVLSSLYSENNENVERVFDLIDENVDQLAVALGGYSSVASAVSGIASRFTTDTQLEKLKAFNQKHNNKFGSSISTLQGAVKSVELNLGWSKAKLGPVKAFLYQHGRNGAPVNSISAVALVFVALIAIIFH